MFRIIFGGELPASFFAVVHGRPGHGKSTLVLRLLEDETFSRPLLAAVEEGLGLGIADRLARAEATRLSVCDARNFPELLAVIEDHEPDVVAIDSASAAGLEAADVLTLRRHYPQLSVLAVIQSTKSGEHRGSQEWLHDADVVVELHEPMKFRVTKSWFGELREGDL